MARHDTVLVNVHDLTEVIDSAIIRLSEVVERVLDQLVIIELHLPEDAAHDGILFVGAGELKSARLGKVVFQNDNLHAARLGARVHLCGARHEWLIAIREGQLVRVEGRRSARHRRLH